MAATASSGRRQRPAGGGVIAQRSGIGIARELPRKGHAAAPDPLRYLSMAYSVLARTWRPQRFDDLLGQDGVVRTLRNAVEGDTLGHAYLFSGLRGVGKTTVARLLAKAVNCVRGPTAEPCGECDSCREIAGGGSLDVVELDGASNRGIDDVRQLKELLRYRPARDRNRVIIIDEVHMLTREAFNALLKSLEEPPPHILFVLATTERHRVPATILSRCQQLEFRPVAADTIRAHLERIAADEGFELTAAAAGTIARAAQGSVRDGLSLLDQLRAFSGERVDEEAVAAVLGVPRFEVVTTLVGRLAAGDAAAALAAIRTELEAGHDPAVVFDEIGRVLRGLLHLAVDPGLESELTADQREQIAPLASELGAGALARMLGLWVEHEGLVRDATHRELALEVAALRLGRWPAIRRLEAMLDTDVGPADAPRGPAGATPAPEAAPGGGGGPPPSDDRGRLAHALWEDDRPRLASAVERAQLSRDGTTVGLAFGADERPFARILETADAAEAVRSACRRLWPEVERLLVTSDGGPDGGDTLERQVRQDEGVRLVLDVLGGEVTRIRPDPGPSPDGGA